MESNRIAHHIWNDSTRQPPSILHSRRENGARQRVKMITTSGLIHPRVMTLPTSVLDHPITDIPQPLQSFRLSHSQEHLSSRRTFQSSYARIRSFPPSHLSIRSHTEKPHINTSMKMKKSGTVSHHNPGSSSHRLKT